MQKIRELLKKPWNPLFNSALIEKSTILNMFYVNILDGWVEGRCVQNIFIILAMNPPKAYSHTEIAENNNDEAIYNDNDDNSSL